MKKRGLSSRIMSVLLSLMMLLSLLPTAVLADESATKTYTKVTSADELVTGEYVMVANNGYAPGDSTKPPDPHPAGRQPSTSYPVFGTEAASRAPIS